MRLSDNFFKKVEKKTNVDKDIIVSLAQKLQGDNMKDESTLRDVVKQISNLTEDKIINAILDDKVPNNIENMID